MSPSASNTPSVDRDGTSQGRRKQPALDPGYVEIDGRSTRDLLAFAREYAKELRFYDDKDQPAGDWSAFFADVDLDDVEAFLRDPGSVDPATAARFARPHFALFLTFVRLLGHARGAMNTLTRDHLDYYYENILGMQLAPPTPDRAFVWVELAPGRQGVELPEGTEMTAGPDGGGREQRYRTERGIVVNRARIAELRSVHVHKRVTDLRSARQGKALSVGEAFMKKLRIALGEPSPGDPLPEYEPRPGQQAIEVDFGLLKKIRKLLEFTRPPARPWLEFFALRDLMRLAKQRSKGAEWEKINEFLVAAARRRPGNEQFTLDPQDPRDFDANFAKAMGGAPDFSTLPLVENVDDLYAHRIDEDAKKFVREKLHFDLADFEAMMRLKLRVDRERNEILRILTEARRRKGKEPGFTLPPGYEFEPLVQAAVGPLDYSELMGSITNLEEYYEAVRQVERHLFLSAEKVAFVLGLVEGDGPDDRDWQRVEDVLREAHREKFYKGRQRALQTTRDKNGFDAMIRQALGEDPSSTSADPLDRLAEFVLRRIDRDFLEWARDNAGDVQDEDWERVYSIVEVAQRNRENKPDPVPRREEWLNLYAAEDATGVVSQAPRWRTFGEPPAPIPAGRPAEPPQPALGWAITSPSLVLRGGTRTIVLTLRFVELDKETIEKKLKAEEEGATRPFLIEVSTAAGWVELVDEKPGVKAKTATEAAEIKFTFQLDPEAEPTAAPTDPKERLGSPWPVLRLRLRHAKSGDRYTTQYELFRHLVLTGVSLNVTVSGLTDLRLRNDHAELKASEPFEPFGASPSVGSRFYVGHPELAWKAPSKLWFDIEWLDLPTDINADPGYYANYDDTDKKIKVDLRVSDQSENAPNETDLFVDKLVLDTLTLESHADDSADLEELDLLDWPRFVQWELREPGLRHREYPSLAAQKAIELAKALVTNPQTITASAYHLNVPYTPQIKELTLSYETVVDIEIADYAPGRDRICHLHPFGYADVSHGTQATGVRFLPEYDDSGELYIGIADLAPPSTLAILFDMADGSADPDLAPEPVRWSYLADNEWRSLDEEHLVRDSTRGLINSGIVELDLQHAAGSNTLLPGDLYWLRASIARDPRSVCDAIGLHTQAVAVEFVDRDNSPEHYHAPLKPGSIQQLVPRQPDVARVHQPAGSVGGRPGEAAPEFHTRVSERLRHKRRALTVWDYERLVLQEFPEIYKVKCLPAASAERPEDLGAVQLIVIPDVRNRASADRFQPTASTELLADIESFLRDKTPADARISVRNPRYVPVTVHVVLRLAVTGDERYWLRRLNEDLQSFLSPWAFDADADIVVGGRIYANSIVDFLDRRSHVDYVKEIRLLLPGEGKLEPAVRTAEGHFVTTKHADGVLVSAPRHTIGLISEAENEPAQFIGINYMAVEVDFTVG